MEELPTYNITIHRRNNIDRLKLTYYKVLSENPIETIHDSYEDVLLQIKSYEE